MATKSKLELKANEILIAEFEYIAQTAFQTNEDRARVTSFYLVSVGSILAAILSAQFEPLRSEAIYIGFALLFALLTAAGILTLLQLIRLRLAWRESALAMNEIKEAYVKVFGQELEQAFRWQNQSLPSAYKRGSVSHLLAVQVSLLSAVVFSVATYFFLRGLEFPSEPILPICIVAWALSALALMRFYRSGLSRTMPA